MIYINHCYFQQNSKLSKLKYSQIKIKSLKLFYSFFDVVDDFLAKNKEGKSKVHLCLVHLH